MAEAADERIRITRTDRGVREDAEAAMGSDPLRALIEFITNADDSYQRLGSAGTGRILIDVVRQRNGRPTIVEVSDRAEGMTRGQMRERLAKQGGLTSGFGGGADVRGLFGRGAKDANHFGPISWDSTQGGERTHFEIDYEGGATDRGRFRTLEPSSDRKRGTTVRLEVQPRFSVPRHDNLKRKLETHYALRPMLEDRKGRTLLLGSGPGSKAEKLVYEPPRGRDLAHAVELPIKGYPGPPAVISLRESEEPIVGRDGDREFWQHSLLIRSGRAAYAIFDGGRFSREPDASLLQRLFGQVDVPGIRKLIAEYDECQEQGRDAPKGNPIRLVDRNRQGLVARSGHPYVAALYSAIESFLEPHIERLREEANRKAGGRVSDDLQGSLRNVGRELAKWMRDEADVDPGGEGEGGTLPPLGVSIVPERSVVEPGSPARVLVRYRTAQDIADLTARVAVSGIESPSEHREVDLEPRGSYFSGSLVVDARGEGESAAIRVAVAGDEREGEIEWRHRDIDPVDVLEFDSATYSVRESQRRLARLRAPWERAAAAAAGPEVKVVGETGITASVQTAGMRKDDERDAAEWIVVLTGRGVGKRAKLQADFEGEQAVADVQIASPGVSGLDVEFVQSRIDQRAWLPEDRGTLFVNADHSAVSILLGRPERAGDRWPGQDDAPFRTMLAELLAATTVRRALQDRKRDSTDVAILLKDYEDKVAALVPRLQRHLIPRSELP